MKIRQRKIKSVQFTHNNHEIQKAKKEYLMKSFVNTEMSEDDSDAVDLDKVDQLQTLLNQLMDKTLQIHDQTVKETNLQQQQQQLAIVVQFFKAIYMALILFNSILETNPDSNQQSINQISMIEITILLIYQIHLNQFSFERGSKFWRLVVNTSLIILFSFGKFIVSGKSMVMQINGLCNYFRYCFVYQQYGISSTANSSNHQKMEGRISLQRQRKEGMTNDDEQSIVNIKRSSNREQSGVSSQFKFNESSLGSSIYIGEKKYTLKQQIQEFDYKDEKIDEDGDDGDGEVDNQWQQSDKLNQIQELRRNFLLKNNKNVSFYDKVDDLVDYNRLSQKHQLYLSDNIQKLDFDIFKVEKYLKDSLITVVFETIFKQQNYYEVMKIDEVTCNNFTRKVRESYFDNSYHNHIHSADVAQFVYHVLTANNGIEIFKIPKMDQICMLVAAFIHDLEHPGVTNNFLISIRSQLAIRYNDKSPLENHHISQTFQILLDEKFNIFKNYGPQEYTRVREQLINCVLATDNQYHFKNLESFKQRIGSDNFDIDNLTDNDRYHIYEQIIHTADISNMTRPQNVSVQWSFRVITEFWEQGDQEKELHLPISQLMDRNTTNFAQSQVGFSQFLVMPQVKNLQQLLPKMQKEVDGINNMIIYWQQFIDQTKPELIQGEITKVEELVYPKQKDDRQLIRFQTQVIKQDDDDDD